MYFNVCSYNIFINVYGLLQTQEQLITIILLLYLSVLYLFRQIYYKIFATDVYGKDPTFFSVLKTKTLILTCDKSQNICQ
jgi:hypothetical protein